MGETLSRILGLQIDAEWSDAGKLFSRLGLDLVVAWAIISGIYARRTARRDYVFTFYAFNIVTFSLCLLLRRVPTELGFALALFGVFGIVRYRT